MSVLITSLGQAGFRLSLGGTVIYIDPYLSDRVERMEGARLKRLRPAPYGGEQIVDASFVLISHVHADHCDVDTLLPLSRASPGCCFIGPLDVVNYLAREGVPRERLMIANRDPLELGSGISVYPLPAAHKQMEQDFEGFLRFLGYVICYEGKRYLHTGDTCVHALLIERARQLGPIDVAFLPVNECNYFRDRAGIIGNMSIREAFRFAEEIGARSVVPMHYDMFEPNQAYREEIQIVYDKSQPAFELQLDPKSH